MGRLRRSLRKAVNLGKPSALGPIPTGLLPTKKGLISDKFANSDFISNRVNEDGSLSISATLDDRASKKGLTSVTRERERKVGEDAEQVAHDQRTAAAAAAEAEKVFDLQKESQKKGQQRKGRRSSILTSSQGASEPLGLIG